MLGYEIADDRTRRDREAVPLIVLGGSDDGWRPPAGNAVVVDAGRDGALPATPGALDETRSLGLLSGPAPLSPLGSVLAI